MNKTGQGEKMMTVGAKLVNTGNFIRRHKILTLILVVLLIGAGWWWSGYQGTKKELGPVKADNRVLAEGIVYPVKYAQMVMPVDGMIGEILVSEGEMVKTGQPLIRLVRQDYKARVGSASADLARTAAAVEQSRVNLADAERELERQQRLFAAGASSKQQLDQAKTATDRSRAALAQSLAEKVTQEARVTEAEGLLEKTELKAPMDGKVAFLDIKIGEHAQSGTVLVRIADESAWEVRTDDLTELVIAKIKEGDQVVLTFDGIPGLEIPAKVKSIRSYGEKKRGDITYTITIQPEKWDQRLRWMMTAQIAITPAAAQ